MSPKACPKCKITWESILEIPEDLYLHDPDRYDTREKAEAAAKNYGWTPENGFRFGTNMVGVEIPMFYDGIAYWNCTGCDACFERFSMTPLTYPVNTEKLRKLKNEFFAMKPLTSPVDPEKLRKLKNDFLVHLDEWDGKVKVDE